VVAYITTEVLYASRFSTTEPSPLGA
jgi:hypothetical protein